MRRILFSLVVFVTLLLAVEVSMTLLSQHGMERALRSQYGLPPGLEADISSFPYLLSVARNHVNEVRLSWEGELYRLVGEGSRESIPYEGDVSLYDVELDVPSLLRGKLKVRNVSLQKAAILLDAEGLNRAYGREEGTMTIDDGRMYVAHEGGKAQYRVKVTGSDSLSIEPYEASTTGTGLNSDPDGGVETAVFHDLPLGAEMLNASIIGDKIRIEVSIPMWEGYL